MKYKWAEENGLRSCPENGGWEDSDFYYRHVGNDIQVGIKKHFDRWANSVDYVFRVPRTASRWSRVQEALRKNLRTGNFHKGWGESVRL